MSDMQDLLLLMSFRWRQQGKIYIFSDNDQTAANDLRPAVFQ